MMTTIRLGVPTQGGSLAWKPAVVAAGIVAVVLVGAMEGATLVVLGLAVAVPIVIAVLRRPQRGVLAMAALAPFDGLLDLFPHPGTLHAWKEVLVVLTLVATFVAPASTRAAPGRRLPSWVPGVAGLIAIGLISAGFVGGAQAEVGFRIDFFYILLAIAIWRCPLGRRDRDRIVSILMATAFVSGLAGLAEEGLGGTRLHALGFAYNTTIRYAGGNLLRVFGTFAFMSPFAYFLMLVILVGVSQVLLEPNRRRNRLFAASLVVLVPALALTFERGAWLGLAAGLLYLGFRRHRAILLTVPLAPLALLWLPSHLTSTATSSSSLGDRSSGWSANFAQLLAHPVGVGIGASGAAAEKVASSGAQASSLLVSTAASATYQPDNYYFKTIYELGLIGLWFLVLFLLAVIMWCDRTAVRVRSLGSDGPTMRDAGLADSTCAFFIAAMVASTVATFFEIYPMDFFTWLLLGVMASCWCD